MLQIPFFFVLSVGLCGAYRECTKGAPVYLKIWGCPYHCLSSNVIQDARLMCEDDGVRPLVCDSSICPVGSCEKGWCVVEKGCNSTPSMYFPSLCQVFEAKFRTTDDPNGEESFIEEGPDVMRIVITIIFVVLGVVILGLVTHRAVMFIRVYVQKRRTREFLQPENVYRDEQPATASAPPAHSAEHWLQHGEIHSREGMPTDDPPPYSDPMPPPYSEIVPPEVKTSLV